MAIALRAWFGQDEVSHGSERYRVGVDRLVFVSPPVAACLIRNAGFQAVSTPDAEPIAAEAAGARRHSLLRVRHPTAAGCSYGGRQYQRDQNAEFLVPAQAVADLIGHGFVPVEAAARPQQNAAGQDTWPTSVSPAGEPQKTPRRGRLAAEDDEQRGPD